MHGGFTMSNGEVRDERMAATVRLIAKEGGLNAV
jgi:hypothetical protein